MLKYSPKLVSNKPKLEWVLVQKGPLLFNPGSFRRINKLKVSCKRMQLSRRETSAGRRTLSKLHDPKHIADEVAIDNITMESILQKYQLQINADKKKPCKIRIPFIKIGRDFPPKRSFSDIKIRENFF